jgi:hypothetical protein
MSDREFSERTIAAAVNASSSEKLKWRVERSGGKFKVMRVPEWGKTPVAHGEHDGEEEAYANMEYLRVTWSMQAALNAALEAEGM